MAANNNPPSGPVSGRALAKMLGVTEGAVRCARDAGRLRRCVLPNKRFDATIAIEEWRATTDPRQQRRTTEATDAAAAADAKRAGGGVKASKPVKRGRAPRAAARASIPEPPAAPAGAEVIDLQARLAAHRAARLAKAAPPPGAPDPAGDDGRTMADIRRDMLLVEEQVQQFDWGVKLGLALPREPILAAVQTLGREFRDATLRIADQYSAQIAAELGVEAHVCHGVLDRYCREHFEAVIARIDVVKILGDQDDDGTDPA